MKRTLSEVLRAVAVDKELLRPDVWVEQRLKKSQVDSDYRSYIHLLSHNRMWFGVRDGEFECQQFILYRQYKNNDDSPEIKEYEIFTFKDLTNDEFRHLLYEAYKEKFDTIEDCRLYFNLHPVQYKINLVNEGYAKLGEYNDINEIPDLITDLFQLTIHLVGENEIKETIRKYAHSIELMKFELLRLKDLNLGIVEEKSNDTCKVYDTSNFTLTQMGKLLKVELYSVNGEYFVDILDKGGVKL